MRENYIENLFAGINPSDHLSMQKALAPWSYTKINSAACAYYVNAMIEKGRVRDFKGGSLSARGGENLNAGIAAHSMIENWIMFNLGKEQLKQPGEILQGLRVSVNDWPLLIQQYEKAKKVFSFKDGEPEFPGGKIIGVEDEIHVDINWNFVDNKNNGDGFFKGTIDLIQWDEENKILTITDHKRQWNVLSDTDLESNFQFSLYATLALAKYPAYKVVRRMYFIRHGFYKEVECFPVELKHIPETIRQQTLAYTLNLYSKKNTPEPFTGEQCDTCDLAMSCPAMINTPQLNGCIRSHEEAVGIASNLILQKKVVSSLEQQLKDWTAEHGPVSTGNKKQYGYVPNKSDSWTCIDPAGFLSEARSLQGNNPSLFLNLKLDVNQLIKLDQKTLDKAMSKLKTHAEETGDWVPYKSLQKYTNTRVTTRFSQHNK